MLKTYLKIIESIKRDGTPYRRIAIFTEDKKTGELFELFNLGMSTLNRDLWDTLIEFDRIDYIQENDDDR